MRLLCKHSMCAHTLHAHHTHTHTFAPHLQSPTDWDTEELLLPPTQGMWPVFIVYVDCNLREKFRSWLPSLILSHIVTLVAFLKETLWHSRSIHKPKWRVQQLSKIKSNRVLCLELFFLTHCSRLRAHSVKHLRFTCPSGGLGEAQTCPSGYLVAEWLRSAGSCQWWNPNSTSPPGPRSWATPPPPHQRKNCPETRPQNRSLWEQWQTA